MQQKKVPVTSLLISFPSLKFGVSVTCRGAFLLCACLLFGGCKETNADKVADAQECLDRYAREGGGDLALCEAYISGLTTPAAQGIRCATGFIREGFGSAQSFIDAFAAIETVSGSSVRTFLNLVSFDSAGVGDSTKVDSNYNAANNVYSNCAGSNAKGATLIATFGFLTNVLYKYECDNLPGSGSMATCAMDDSALGFALAIAVTDGSGSTTSMLGDLGTIVVNTSIVSCSSGKTNEKLCEFMETAIDQAGGTSNKQLVGKKFLEVLANP
jgi:hypothetical protein